jgi:hypothetical protein
MLRRKDACDPLDLLGVFLEKREQNSSLAETQIARGRDTLAWVVERLAGKLDRRTIAKSDRASTIADGVAGRSDSSEKGLCGDGCRRFSRPTSDWIATETFVEQES